VRVLAVRGPGGAVPIPGGAVSGGGGAGPGDGARSQGPIWRRAAAGSQPGPDPGAGDTPNPRPPPPQTHPRGRRQLRGDPRVFPHRRTGGKPAGSPPRLPWQGLLPKAPGAGRSRWLRAGAAWWEGESPWTKAFGGARGGMGLGQPGEGEGKGKEGAVGDFLIPRGTSSQPSIPNVC